VWMLGYYNSADLDNGALVNKEIIAWFKQR
jgi:hypothetical protein